MADDNIRSKVEELRQVFGDAHEAWNTADNLVHRMLRPVVDARLGDMAAGADYRTPDLEEEEHRYIEFLTGVQIEFEARPGVDSPTGQKEADNAALWFKRWWAKENEGGRVQEMWSAGQVRHGVKAWRLLTRNLNEPDKDVDREEWMQTRDSVFYIRDTNNTTAFWDPIIGGYNHIVMEYELTVHEAKNAYRVDGADIGRTKGESYIPIHDRVNASGVAWVGEEEDPYNSQKSESQSEKLIVTVCEYRDATKLCPVCPDKHPLWVGKEYIRGASKALKDADIVREYVLPWKKWPSIRITEGRTSPLDRDPHWHYRPLEIKLLVEAATWNWANAMLLATANDDMIKGAYMQANSQVPQEIVNLLDGASMRIPENTQDEVDLMPGQVLRWPSGITDSLVQLRDAAERRFEQAKINPVLFGEAYDEARQAPGTSFVLLLRQARIPFNRPIVKQQQAVLDIVSDIQHAILFWDYEAGKDTEQRFYVELDGEEGGTPGEKVYLSASRLSTHPNILLGANAEQLAEQQARHEADWQDYLRNLMTIDQVLKGRGYKDVEAQKKLLDEDRQRRLSQPLYDNARTNLMIQMAADLLDMDPGALLSNPLSMPQQPAGQEQPAADGLPSPTIRPPALSQPLGPQGAA